MIVLCFFVKGVGDFNDFSFFFLFMYEVSDDVVVFLFGEGIGIVDDLVFYLYDL